MKIIASQPAMRRWLGGAFLAVFVLSVVTQLPQLVVETDGAKKLLVAVADSASLLRLRAVAELLNSLAIGVLAALLYVVLSRRHRALALVALGWWWAEAIVLATSTVASLVLIDLSVEICRLSRATAQSLSSGIASGRASDAGSTHVARFDRVSTGGHRPGGHGPQGWPLLAIDTSRS